MPTTPTNVREGLRLAVIQPHARPVAEAELAVTDAVDHVRAAAEAGAELVLFPEGYPGPLRVESAFDASGPLAAAAREHGCAVCWSRIEHGTDGLYRKVVYVHGPDGEQALRYVRAHPATGDVHPVLSGTALAPGDDLGVVDVAGVRIGVMVCSELWIPEVSRVLALRGAELLLGPAGGGFNEVAENWRIVTRVRAIENNCYAAMTQNLFGDEDGSALIAGPEGVVADGPRDAMIVADLDLARVRWMRATDDSMAKPKPFRALPGQLRARRPELYGALAAPRDGLYDYEAAGRLGTEAPVPASASGRVEVAR